MMNATITIRRGTSMFSRFFRNVVVASGIVVAGAAAMPQQASAQSDILLRLRSGSPPGDRFRVDSAGGVVALGSLGVGIIPASGCGFRLMWHPFRAAFRAGSPGQCPATPGSPGTQWDEANIGFYSWAGGNETKASAFATFAFGDGVEVTGVDGAGFGSSNTVSGTAGFTAGASNRCTGFGCTAIGFTNTAGGQGAIAIGYRVTANCDYCVALGHRASANGHDGSFNIGDESNTDSVMASANNQFNARYAGGYRLYTNAGKTLGVQLAPNATSWTTISDRNVKENFRSLKSEDILKRISAIQVSVYNYKDDPDKTKHIGPMAQDFQKAFRLNSDDKHINMSDLDGVNLAGVQALEARTRRMQAEIDAKDKKIESLEERIARLEALLQKR
ncbi:MAG TPA: tail fiber domain-containing protein [Gemmatimonadaceae bacterium]